MPNKMPNPFRAISGNTTPKKSPDNPPRAIFSDYPAAHSAITSVPAAKGEKIPSPTPGMPTFDNPFARLPPTIDLPETPEKYTGGPAPEEIKVRVANSEFTGVDVAERPPRPLLPPTFVQIQAARHDGEVPFHDSTAGHTPPLSNLIFARQVPERSTSGLPPRDPLAVAPAGQAFRYARDVSSSELTNRGNAQNLMNMAGAHEESDAIKAVAGVEYNRHQDLVFNPTGMSTYGRLQLMDQGLIPVYRDAPNQEREMFETSTSVGSPKVGSEYGIGVGNESAGSVKTFLQPVAYMPNADDSRLSSVGSALPVHPAVNQERDEEDEGEEPIRLRRRVEIPPAPDMSRHRQVLDPGGPQSSSTQSMSADSSFRRGRPASRRFQSSETLASLTGEGTQGSQQDMQTLIEDVGAMFGVAEEDGTVFEDDVVAVKPEEEGDDCDWETVHESGLKNSNPQRSMTHHDETATSLANMSSYASLTHSVPATPCGPLLGRARVLTYPAKVAVPSRSRVQTDTKTSLSVMLPEYEASDDLHSCDEHEMTESIRPPALERPFPALAATNLPSATRQQRSYANYRHPEPMSEEHKHPFSLTPPTMTPTEGPRANFPTNPSITSNEVQCYGPAEKDKGSGEDATRTGLVISKKRNTQQLSASVSGYSFENNMPDLRELSRPSNASIDGSYTESVHSGPVLSTSSITHNSQYLPHARRTFSETTILGPKSNITGSFDGTGMRAVGSSESDYSTDSAIMKSHKYERLDDERTRDQANRSTKNNPTAQDTPKTPKNVTFTEDSEIQMEAQVPTPVLTKNGLPISGPRAFRIPTTVPKRNSFAISTLNAAKGLDNAGELAYTPRLFDYDAASPNHKANICALIEMRADDWNRLQSECITFPLRDDHLNDMLELDGVSTGQPRCHRDNIAPDGRYMESARCDNCNRWERSHAAVLVRRPFNTAQLATQKEIGSRIVFWSAVVPVIGWGFLFAIANRKEASSDLIAAFTQDVIREFREEEIEAANHYFNCILAAFVLLFLGLLAFTIVIVARS